MEEILQTLVAIATIATFLLEAWHAFKEGNQRADDLEEDKSGL